MAKCGVTNVNGGAGIGSEEISVTKEYVLDGKTYVGADTEDEIGTGKMANNGTTTNQSLNADGTFYIKKGYHEQGFTVIANNLASQTSATALTNEIIGGKSAWVNGKKITGTIPIQNSDTDGDRVWATTASNWAGTINVGVRNNHYFSGVNWIRYDVPTLRPENIKKGVDIAGIRGTWEGWVPQPTDLYYRGNNVAGLTGSSYSSFESGSIRLKERYLILSAVNPINISPFSRINIEFLYENYTGSGRVRNMSIRGSFGIRKSGYHVFEELIGQTVVPASNYTNYTISIPTNGQQRTIIPSIIIDLSYEYYSENDGWVWSSGGNYTGWFYRVWFS